MIISAEEQYKKMTETPVGRLIVSLGIPTTISMLVTNLYNMADTYFVSELGNSASGAVGVVFALMAIIQAFGFMYGQGAGSNIGRLLGAHNTKRAGVFATTSLVTGMITGVIITVFGFCYRPELMRLLGSTDTILPYAMEYSKYILLAAPLMIAGCILNNILRFEGKAAYAMIGLVSGGILNIFGDFYLIKILGLGVKGAGIATAGSQCISFVILLLPFMKKIPQSRISFRLLTREFGVIGNIIAVGMPSMMRQGLNSISTMILNKSAAPYGDEAIAAMSIVARVIGLLFCVGLGIGQGFQPVCGFNFGAGKYDRVKKSYWFTYCFMTILLGFTGLLGFIFAPEVVRMFRDDVTVVSIGTVALRYQSISLLFVPMTVSGNMLFQSAGKSGRATFLAATRSGLFFIPIIILLSQVMGLKGIEISQALADVMAAACTLPIVLVFLRSLKTGDKKDI